MNEVREQGAVRRSTALSLMDHVCAVRVSGDDAYTALDRICPADLHVRDGQMHHTLLLGEDGLPLADLYLCADDEDFVLLAEGIDGPDLVEHVRLHAGVDVDVVDKGATHRVVSVNGPYAWELLGEVIGPDVVGLPYMTFYHLENVICFRAGKTGEYGYDLLVPEQEAEPLLSRLRAAGKAFDLAEVGLATLDQCALENNFFNIRMEGASGADPIELQLQWRISYRKRYVGSDVLHARRSSRRSRRLTCLVSDADVAPGEMVAFDGRIAGRIVNSGVSRTRGDVIALALVQIEVAHPGLDGFSIGGKPARSVSPPVIANRSLYVSPQSHGYATRGEQDFPPLTRTR